jgi:hypothetical protein
MGGEGVVMGGRNLWYIPYTEKVKMDSIQGGENGKKRKRTP